MTATKKINRLKKPVGNGRVEIPPLEVKTEVVKIKPLRMTTITFRIFGGDGSQTCTPYMQNRFSQKAADQIRGIQEAGSTSRGKKVREPKDFDQCFRDATYRFKDGGYGMPASAFRKAMISACRTVGFAMTLAKLSVFIVEDGRDATDGTPLVRISGGGPVMDVRPARNDNGKCDMRARPRWDKWSANVRVRFDRDQFTASDVANLMVRVGMQVGIGEGRPDSDSGGIGFGLFDVDLDSLDG